MNGTDEKSLEQAFSLARERYAGIGIDVDEAIARLGSLSLSLPCWQGDDGIGFENSGAHRGGGIMATGNYPGRARNADELRRDYEAAFSLIPGRHRANLHSIYAETPGKVDRDRLEPAHFARWMDWAKERKIGLDFNPTFYSHPLATDGFTLSHPDRAVREFWIEHALRCRTIGEAMGRALSDVSVTNIWIPDGFKDSPVGRAEFRRRLAESLDTIIAGKKDPRFFRESVEAKLFGLGSESCVIGSHEFYLGYAQKNRLLLCLDLGHFHPTEQVYDKISSVLMFNEEILLHVSRPVRWDSDHVVTMDGELENLALEIVRGGFGNRVRVGLDYFDASINRIAAWVIGARNVQKAFLRAYLEPSAELKSREERGDYTWRLAWLEEAKSLPWQAVWDRFCLQSGVPVGSAWLDRVRDYETKVQAARVEA
jgi:L-rhamnose isomerase